MTKLVELRNVSRHFHGGTLWKRETTIAVNNVSLSLDENQAKITGIVGESGSGKTTLALLLLGHETPTSGQVIYRGGDVAKMSSRERFEYRRQVQPIFQDPFSAYNPFYRVDHVLTTPIERFNLANSAQDARRRIGEALELVGLRPNETLGRFPHQLSGGQRQRLMVARALLCQPKLIVADEPVSMVDASLRATILASLQTLNQELDISIIYITHDLTTAYQVCDNLVVMYAGSVVEAGAAGKIIQDPQHPYTQLLINSIPSVDRAQRWEDLTADETPNTVERAVTGCRFAPRCPQSEELCWRKHPPLYHTEPERATACVHYREHKELEQQDIGNILA